MTILQGNLFDIGFFVYKLRLNNCSNSDAGIKIFLIMGSYLSRSYK